MTYTYDNTEVPADRNFTDIHAPDGMVSEKEALAALLFRDAAREMMHDLQMQLCQEVASRIARDADTHTGDGSTNVQTNAMTGEAAAIVTDAFLDAASREEWEYHRPEIVQAIHDLRKTHGGLKADRDVVETQMKNTLAKLHAAHDRERDLTDQLTDLDVELGRANRIIDHLLGGQLPAVSFSEMAVSQNEEPQS